MTAAELVTLWDAGKIVPSISMGGIGPGYEQVIQILVMELVRDGEPLKRSGAYPNPRWGEAAVSRCSAGVGGFSGAQVGAAKSLAWAILRDGPDSCQKQVSKDRHILVSRFFPQAPAVSP